MGVQYHGWGLYPEAIEQFDLAIRGQAILAQPVRDVSMYVCVWYACTCVWQTAFCAV